MKALTHSCIFIRKKHNHFNYKDESKTTLPAERYILKGCLEGLKIKHKHDPSLDDCGHNKYVDGGYR